MTSYLKNNGSLSIPIPLLSFFEQLDLLGPQLKKGRGYEVSWWNPKINKTPIVPIGFVSNAKSRQMVQTTKE